MTQPSNGDEAQRPGSESAYPPAVDPFDTRPQPPVPQPPVPQPPVPQPPVPQPPVPPAATDPTQPPGAAYAPPDLRTVAPADQTPRKRRALLITTIVLGLALLLCGGGGVAAWLYLTRVERGQGADAPETAVDAFLTAVYDERDADRAAKVVCLDARDTAEITKKVDEVTAYAEKYKTTRFEWDDPKVEEKTDDRARISVKVTASTGDEREASLDLTFTVIRDSGWWVCEVQGSA
jgi:Domain of unknown function (DUF4878)